MNNLNDLKKHYDKKGWVVYKKLFSVDQINLINSIIDDFLNKKIKSNNKVNRSINFIDNKKNINNIN